MLSIFKGLLRGMLLSSLLVSAVGAAPRETVNLDGVWSFATDSSNRGETEEWFKPEVELPTMPLPGYAPEANGIEVPGIWDNQGYGVETEVMRHNAPGKGWYRRQVPIPEDWSDKRIFLYIGGVHRYSKVWVNGHGFGEHIGFVSDFEYDITDSVEPGQEAFITIQVDSKQRWEVDALYGAADYADYMNSEWGGIWGHVRLEARADAWLSDLFVQPDVRGSACTATTTINGLTGAPDAVKLEVFDMTGQRVAETMTKTGLEPASSKQPASVTAKIPDPSLWTPGTPTLYTAKLSLLKADDVLDTLQSRFGMRQFTIDGHHILLNGKRIILRGYGDDHIYPEQMAMPSDKGLHVKRLRVIKSYGFNHVRHHSTMMPPEYYEACDEVGMISTAEFPIVYSHFIPGTGGHWLRMVKPGTDPAPAIDTYRREWSGAIKRFRNHPSILCWVMGNEFYGGNPLAFDFQREMRRLDPSRFFADSDGVFGFDVSSELASHLASGEAVNVLDPQNDRDTLDLYFMQFVDPITYDAVYPAAPPLKPAIVHEMGNFLTFARPDVTDQFQHNIKPFWLTAGEDKLKKLGLYEEAALWAERSERLYISLHKRNVETIRKNRFLSGYHWWLFQDYWTTSNGLVDLYFRPKSIPPKKVLQFNNDAVLLQDGLARTYRGHDILRLKFIMSNYSDSPINGEAVWEITLGGELLARKMTAVQAPQGEVTAIETIAVELPDVAEPTQLKIAAELTNGGDRHGNDWSAWVYPASIQPMPSSMPVFVADSCREEFANWSTTPIPAEGELVERAVYVTENLSAPRILDAMSRGAAVVLTGPQTEFWPSYRVTFGTTLWKAGDSPQRNHTGTFVYDHPITRAIAPDGWCDDGWFDLLEGGNKFILEKVPSRPNIIVRALPSMVLMEESSLLFEVGVGEGCLIVSGLNHRHAAGRPENQWLLTRLLEYAAMLPKPKAHWPASFFTLASRPDPIALDTNL